jgi:hypothetical protein
MEWWSEGLHVQGQPQKLLTSAILVLSFHASSTPLLRDPITRLLRGCFSPPLPLHRAGRNAASSFCWRFDPGHWFAHVLIEPVDRGKNIFQEVE